ncbi:MAG: DUF2272 domain-containing protein [Rhodospirillaceae bacterium]|nr:DUF2272 domain-containing protein [Rhodospirillaceae bacterium]
MGTLPLMPPTTLDAETLTLAGPGTIGRIVRVLLAEWNRFGQQVMMDGRVVQRGWRETQTGFDARVGLFWRYGTGLSYDGDDTDQAWSAAFISYVMRTAGVPDQLFPRSRRHSTYIHFAQQNALANDPDAAFVAHRLEQYTPKVGDLLAYTRSGAADYDRYVNRDRYKSHTDIVTYAHHGEIGVIGGNVADSVTLKRLKRGSAGRLIDHSHAWFAAIENRLPPR